jgi:predicted nucleic acid-binding protein
MYLVDTNVISASAPGRSAPPGLGDWMDQNASLLFLSSVTIAEVTEGIAKARREGSTRKADDLPFDASVAQTLGGLSDHARAIGRSPGLADLIIAATAKHHGLTILTRNVRHFAPLTVAVHDPYVSFPT